MTNVKGKENFAGLDCEWFQFPGFEVSWAGENPKKGGLIFGSDDGRLKATGPDGLDDKPPVRVSDSSEAINGVAFTDESMAVSTRSDITFIDIAPGSAGPSTGTVYPGGAHGVVATSTGIFVAPLGPEGLLLMDPESDPTQPMRKLAPREGGLNLYKTARLHGDGREDLFACAARRGGLLAVTVLKEGAGPGGFFKAPNLDVVDVCALGSPQWPRAAAALGADLSLHLFRDLIDGNLPQTLYFKEMSGTAYSILHSDGHIFLLTSRGLYFLPRLASRLLAGDDIGGLISGGFLSLRAVDVYLAYKKLIIVEADRVVAVTIDSIIAKGESSGGINSSYMENSPILGIPWESALSQEWDLVPAASI